MKMRIYLFFLMLGILAFAELIPYTTWNSSVFGNSINAYPLFPYIIKNETAYQNVQTTREIWIRNATRAAVNITQNMTAKQKMIAAGYDLANISITEKVANGTVANRYLDSEQLILKHEDTLNQYRQDVCLPGSICNPDNYTTNTPGIASATNGFVVAGQDYAEIVNKAATENLSLGDVICIKTGAIATKNTSSGCIDYGVVSGSTAGFIGGSKTSDLYKIVNGTKVMKDDFTGATHVPIAFTGILKVKVNGSITAGNWVIPSGANDGYGKAIATSSLTTVSLLLTNIQLKIGIAYETNASAGVHYILTRTGGRT